MQESTMRLRLMLAVAALTVVVGGGVAIAAHAPEIDPATVPTGFFVAPGRCRRSPGRADCAGGEAGWGRCVRPALEPGCEPGVRMARILDRVVVTVRSGSVIYQDAGPNVCAIAHTRQAEGSSIPAGVPCTRVVAESVEAEIYSTFFLPPSRRTT